METLVAPLLSDYEADRRKPMPSKNHAFIQMRISGTLFSCYASQFTILPEIRIEITGSDYTPDICIYPLIPFDSRHDEIRMTELPLTAIEILSPTQSVEELVAKFEVYFGAGVRSGWLVQPALQTIFLLTPDQKISVFHDELLVDPTTGIELNLSEVFQ
ncbi:Uma2 family endonuclease [Spirosoma validum]|uniref:Uma2 family endonuclease n=1 Tax=Spirosoma validum TaxID=2771355 RepID=A0A927B118_9BACT|nr:Uma2 family endonuclease [Spirosoma validum]MBD2753378.1 Uma2 family endonuclease [Spirosoma validum]